MNNTTDDNLLIKNPSTLQDELSEGNVLRYAIIFSLLIHAALLVNFSIRAHRDPARVFDKVEVTYYNLKLQAKKAEPAPKRPEKLKEAVIKDAQVLLKKESTAPSPIKDMTKLVDKLETSNKQPATISAIEVKRKVSVPPIKSEKIENPYYQTYYQKIRSMIKERAYTNYSQFDTGEVYLTFVLLADGTLKQVQLIEERTTANDFLKKISLKSIQECHPFPPFPKDLAYPELSFNVVISFEVEK